MYRAFLFFDACTRVTDNNLSLLAVAKSVFEGMNRNAQLSLLQSLRDTLNQLEQWVSTGKR